MENKQTPREKEREGAGLPCSASPSKPSRDISHPLPSQECEVYEGMGRGQKCYSSGSSSTFIDINIPGVGKKHSSLTLSDAQT